MDLGRSMQPSFTGHVNQFNSKILVLDKLYTLSSSVVSVRVLSLELFYLISVPVHNYNFF